MNPEQTLEELPLLRSKNLLGSYSYSDAYMDDDRLVLETLRSAVSMGARAVNFVKAGQARMDSQGRMEAVEIEDKLTQKKYWVRAQHFISAVGAWTDQFAKGIIPWRPIMRPTKGIHLTIARDRFPLKDAVVMAAEKRIIFGIPRHEMVIIGTTDTDFKQSPEEVHTTLEDVDYLLEIVGKYFPKAQLGKDDILASYAGVRPLVDDGSSTESKTSREHVIMSTPHNLTFVAGGKYTTYRLIAEQVMKKALVNFPIEKRIRFGLNDTKQPVNPMITRESMHEVQKEIEDWVLEYRISPQEAEVLIQRHGPEARFLLQDGHTQTLRNVWEMEAYFAIRNTMCLRLKDFMLRRSPLFLAQKDHGQALLGGIAQVFQKELGWSDSRTEEEKKLYLKHLDFELSWKS